MRRFVIAICMCAAALVPSAVRAQADAWEGQVRRLLDEGGKTFRDRGYSLTHSPTIGSLGKGRDQSLEVQLESGKQYVFFGVCDTDCSDLDMALYDGGTMLGQDVETDDVPIVTHTPTRSGTFQLKVSMVTCTNEPCRYGVGVYAKQ
jgi:hypothetical protein